MTGYQFTRPARDDLFEIWEFIARDNLDAADRVIARIEGAARKLATHPQMGHRRPALAPAEVRFWPVGAYVVVYRAAEKPLQILRVLHGARDLDSILAEE